MKKTTIDHFVVFKNVDHEGRSLDPTILPVNTEGEIEACEAEMRERGLTEISVFVGDEHDAVKTSLRVVLKDLPENPIDESLVELIKDLNAAGFKTWASCQGKTCEADFTEKRHTAHSFITFEYALNKTRRRRAKLLGLFVYNGNVSVSGVELTGNETQAEIIEANKAFPDKVRKLFL